MIKEHFETAAADYVQSMYNATMKIGISGLGKDGANFEGCQASVLQCRQGSWTSSSISSILTAMHVSMMTEHAAHANRVQWMAMSTFTEFINMNITRKA